MQQLKIILVFYKPFFLWSFAINIVIAIVNPDIIPAIITKLLLTILLWYLIHETSARKKLIFYKNAGISSTMLFTSIFLIDVLLMLFFLLLTQRIL